MGHKISDGKTVDVTAPAGVINFGDLYRIGKWNGIAMSKFTAEDTARGMALEVSAEHIWKVKLPVALDPGVGDLLYWANPAIFQKGDTHLQANPASAGDAPACKVASVKNDAGYAAVRVLNAGGGGIAIPDTVMDVEFTVGAEGSNHIDVTMTFKDADGDTLAVRSNVFAYLSDDANGDSLAATAPATSVAIQTDGLAIELVTKKAWRITSEATGVATLRITETGAATWYLIVVLPDGTLKPSGAITFAA